MREKKKRIKIPKLDYLNTETIETGKQFQFSNKLHN